MGHEAVSFSDVLVITLQVFGPVIGVNLRPVSRYSGAQRLPRENLGYDCRRGSGITCDCEEPGQGKTLTRVAYLAA